MTTLTKPDTGAAAAGSMLEQAGRRLAGLRHRARIGIWIEAGALLLLALLGYAAITWALDRHLRLEWPFRLVLLAAFAFAAARIARRRLLLPLAVPLDDDEMAIAVERRSPSLQQALISSLQFERMLRGGGRVVESEELMAAVVADVHGRLHTVPFAAALDARRVRNHGVLGAGVLALFLLWGIVDGQSLRIWALRNLALASVAWPRYTSLSFAGTEGEVVRLPQGDPLTVHVAVGGPVPDQVFLRYDYKGGDRGVEAMSRTGDREFTLTVPALIEDAVLSAEGGDGVSPPLRIEIVERPRLEDVVVRVVFPAYMKKEPETVPATEGELRLLRGSELQLAGRSHKPLREAFALFEDEKIPLQRDGDRAFRGSYVPKSGGLLKLDVIDEDQLGAGSPPKLLVRMVDDKPPTIDFKMRGISTLITAQARIPGDLKIKDDFGITAVTAGVRVVDDTPEARKPAAANDQPQPAQPQQPPAPLPFDAVEAIFGDALAAGAVKYETAASIDLKQLNKTPDADAPGNKVRPGMLLSLRFQAKDNYGPGEPHLANGEVLSFRVVTQEKLIEELRRRQVEQREEAMRIRDEERTAMLELKETLNPKANDEHASLAKARFKTLARQQQGLGRRVAFVGDVYQRILWEYENNRVWEPKKTREFEEVITMPLAALAREAFPATSKQVDEFAGSADEALRTAALAGYAEILERLDAIIEVMERAETLAAVLEHLRGVIKLQDQAVIEAERRLKEAGERIFRPGDKRQGAGNDPEKHK